MVPCLDGSLADLDELDSLESCALKEVVDLQLARPVVHVVFEEFLAGRLFGLLVFFVLVQRLADQLCVGVYHVLADPPVVATLKLQVVYVILILLARAIIRAAMVVQIQLFLLSLA